MTRTEEKAPRLVARSVPGMLIRDSGFAYGSFLLVAGVAVLVTDVISHEGLTPFAAVVGMLGGVFGFSSVTEGLWAYRRRAPIRDVERSLKPEIDTDGRIREYMEAIRRYPLIRDLELINTYRNALVERSERRISEKTLREQLTKTPS